MFPRPQRPNVPLGARILLGCGILALTFASCSKSSPGATADAGTAGATLQTIQYGKLADIYGLRTIGGQRIVELYRADVLVGPDIPDERDGSTTRRDEEILYDFLGANPDTLQARLLITREIDSAEFVSAFAALDAAVRTVSPSRFGADTSTSPYSIVPRNAAIRLRFSRDLGVTEDFFYQKDQNGQITGIKNAQAIQLLKIVGDPTDRTQTGDFEMLDARIVVRGKELILDPVLLGTEGLQYGVRNNAAGLPASPDQSGANIRLAIATDGPLAIPGLKADDVASLNGTNNDGFAAVVRDFRSGNSLDNSGGLARGFLRDPVPPRLVGEMLMYLERVETAGDDARLITIYKDGINHELDQGDLLRLFVDGSGVPLASMEILTDPEDDRGRPERQRVRLLVRPLLGPGGEDLLELHDPSEKPGFPQFAGEEREDWVRRNAPKAVLVCEFTQRRLHPVQPDPDEPVYYGDDPRNFISFSPRPGAFENGAVSANENISPFAGAILRFSKPIDTSTLIASDTAFFATRNVLDKAAIAEFIAERNIDPTTFNEDKFRTPHLIHSRIHDEDGSQTTVRIQPILGFYLDQAMRDAAAEDADKDFSDRRYHYFLHIVSGLTGITDLTGNALDFQAVSGPGTEVQDHVAMEFALDTRIRPNSEEPRFEDNLAIYVVRRFANRDEDERPNYYQPGEVTPDGGETPADAFRNEDFFGAVTYLPSGELVPRAATRTRKIVDNLNQVSAPPQTSTLRWCPVTAPSAFASNVQIVSRTAGTPFGQPIRNPVNPFGCRLQMVWREIDMSLSRTDPQDFNLDVEQMYWAPFQQNAIVFDEFDRMTLYLGHSEFRPETCISSGSAFPSMPGSGLDIAFENNYANNRSAEGNLAVEYKPERHPAYVDAVMTVNPTDAILEPNGVNRYLPLPKFIDATRTTGLRNPFFVWRDEQEIVQGGVNGLRQEVMGGYPYLLSPFLGGRGRRVFGPSNNLQFQNGAWHNAIDRQLRNGNATDTKTGGCVGSIALPLLADFWTYPDQADLPEENPFRASGITGWQVSLPVTSSARPDFRVYSAGRVGESNLVDPTSPKWQRGSGGFDINNAPTPAQDNTVYWVMADFLKRTTVATHGFIDIANPHRMPMTADGDPRLGPYDVTDRLPSFSYEFEPPLSELPAGTGVVAEFRGASKLTRANNWWPVVGSNPNDEMLFPNDPLKAGDAHIRHWDTRNTDAGVRRRWWSHLYNDTVTSYTTDPNDLMDKDWLEAFRGPNDTFGPEEVKYFNWRFILRNNVEASPPVSPRIESFAVAYRLSPR